jgi:hypothetical protein
MKGEEKSWRSDSTISPRAPNWTVLEKYPQVEGLPVPLSKRHAKIRREGYYRPRTDGFSTRRSLLPWSERTSPNDLTEVGGQPPMSGPARGARVSQSHRSNYPSEHGRKRRRGLSV